jgi:L-asparaginase/Glu-tRNA(Gln) amidotransferase subunit D
MPGVSSRQTDEIGTVASTTLNPSKVRVLVELALMKTSDAKKVQSAFYRY